MDFTNVDMNALAKQLRQPTGEYGREVGEFMAGKNNEAIAFTLQHLGVDPTDQILEIGFGPGEGIAQAVLLTPQGFVCGLDFSEDMLEMAQKRNNRALMQEHVELTFGEARKMPYDDENFQKIFAVNVFHFWPDPMPELAECNRVLLPGGSIAFFTSYPASYMPGIKESGVFTSREPDEVGRILVDAGFSRTVHHDFALGDFRGYVVVATKH